MTQHDRLFSLEQVDMAIKAIYVTSDDTETLKNVFMQLADSMRENERLEETIKRTAFALDCMTKKTMDGIGSSDYCKHAAIKNSCHYCEDESNKDTSNAN